MNRKLLPILIVILSMLLCACGSAKSGLYEQGLDVISRMDELVRSDGYGTLFSVSPEIQDVALTIRQGEYASPAAVYKLTLPANALLSMLGEEETTTWNGFTETMRDMLAGKTMSSVVNQLNGQQGAARLAASAVYAVGKTFVSPESADCIYLYVYENSYPVAVTFTAGEDSTVSASGSFLLLDGFPTESAESIKEVLKTSLGGIDCMVEEVAVG